MPKIVPASPEASALYKVSDVPIDYSSGTANISIPIYTIQEGKINVPISVSYNTGGIKVQDISGMVGLGWNFSWGGIITVKQDASTSGQTIQNAEFKQETDIRNTSSLGNKLIFTNSLLDGSREKQSREYHYQFGGYSGSFIYDINDRLSINSNQQNLLIEKITDGFNITSPDGLTYTFTVKETTAVGALSKISSYFLARITDKSSDRFVYFKYKTKPGYRQYQESQAISYEMYPSPAPTCSLPGSSTNSTTTVSDVYGMQLDSVVFNTGYIKVSASNDRQDIDQTRITGLDVFNYNNNKVKSIKFNQSYFVSTGAQDDRYNKRLKLDSMSILNVVTNQAIERYKFNYNTSSLPSYRQPDGRNSTGIDYWGYYNGKAGQSGIIPRDLIAPSDFTSFAIPTGFLGDRKPDSLAAQASILNKVQYPTGGVVQFVYESNQIPGYQLGDVVGGVRIKKIIYFDNQSNQPRVKYLKYLKGNMPSFFTKNVFSYDKTLTAICSNPKCNLYPSGYCSSDHYFRFINSDPIGSLAYLLINPFYSEVEEYDLINGRSNKKTKYYFDTVSQFWIQPIPSIEFGGLYVTGNDWLKHDLLLKTEYYKFNQSGNYSLVKKEQNKYRDENKSNPLIGMHVTTKPNYDFVGGDYIQLHPEAANNMLVLTPYYYVNARSSHGSRLLVSKSNVEYFGADSLVSKTDYDYAINNFDQYDSDNYFYRLYRKTDINSQNDTLYTYYSYSLDKSDFTDADAASKVAIDSMKARNMTSQVLQLRVDKSITTNSIDRTTYNVWAINSKSYVLPKTIYSSTLTNPMEQRIQFNAYDAAGNITEQLKYNGVKNSYIWDYRLSYPTAEILNASLSEVAYTSFEAENNGGWIVPSAIRMTNSSSGVKSYSLSNGAITRSGIISGKNYILSYCSPNGAYTISGISNPVYKQTPLVNGWVYYEYKTSFSTTNISVIGTGLIDNLRLYPENAQMITSTYIPLIGKTSETGTKGASSTFEYDDFTRLVTVKDFTGSIVKNLKYNYVPPTTSMPEYYTNNPTGGTFTKNSSLCGTGFFGETVTYYVPTGSYYASTQTAADALAQSDLTTNGQAYADKNGRCLPSPPVISSLTFITKRSFEVNYIPITGCTSAIIHYQDISNGTVGATVDVSGDCSSPRGISINPDSFGTFRVTITCYSPSVPAGITSAYKDIYLPY